uniref:Secreted protein n=1 Tax=Angiostrongylus cantonensis TaxID=6313 RepID=A0A0K0DAR7_ANGCA
MVLELLPLWLLLIRTTSAVPSVRGKCSLECYSRCMQSGTVSGILSENLLLSYCFAKLLSFFKINLQND